MKKMIIFVSLLTLLSCGKVDEKVNDIPVNNNPVNNVVNEVEDNSVDDNNDVDNVENNQIETEKQNEESVENENTEEELDIESSDEEIGGGLESNEKQTEIINGVTQLEIIFDDSGSMRGQIDGTSKIEIAKESFDTVINNLTKEEDIEIGLRVYGHKNKECTNSILEIPIGTDNVSEIKNIVNGLTPLGYTPITYSLEKAADDFDKDKDGEKVIVLITDGIESCEGDPCLAAQKLQEAGIVTKVHVVGFGMKESELNTLKCVTEPSGGLLIGADSAEELDKGFDKIVEQTVKYNLEISAVDGDEKDIIVSYEIYKSDDLNKIIEKGDTSLGYKASLLLESGEYDIKVINDYTKNEKWFKNVIITDTKKVEKKAIFTQTLIHLTCSDENGKNINNCDIYVYNKTGNQIKYADTSMSYSEFFVDTGIYDIKIINNNIDQEKWLKDFDATMGGKVEKDIVFAQTTLNFVCYDSNGKKSDSCDIYVFDKSGEQIIHADTSMRYAEFVVNADIYDIQVIEYYTKEEKWIKDLDVSQGGKVNKEINF